MYNKTKRNKKGYPVEVKKTRKNEEIKAKLIQENITVFQKMER